MPGSLGSPREETFKWAMQRKVFGKPLIEQPVIREKLAQLPGAKPVKGRVLTMSYCLDATMKRGIGDPQT